MASPLVPRRFQRETGTGSSSDGHFTCLAIKAADIGKLGLHLAKPNNVIGIELRVAAKHRANTLAGNNCTVVMTRWQASSWEHRAELGRLAEAVGHMARGAARRYKRTGE